MSTLSVSLIIIGFLLAVATIFAVDMPLVLDYPDHLARFWLLSGGDKIAPISHMYQVDWQQASTNIGVRRDRRSIGKRHPLYDHRKDYPRRVGRRTACRSGVAESGHFQSTALVAAKFRRSVLDDECIAWLHELPDLAGVRIGACVVRQFTARWCPSEGTCSRYPRIRHSNSPSVRTPRFTACCWPRSPLVSHGAGSSNGIVFSSSCAD